MTRTWTAAPGVAIESRVATEGDLAASASARALRNAARDFGWDVSCVYSAVEDPDGSRREGLSVRGRGDGLRMTALWSRSGSGPWRFLWARAVEDGAGRFALRRALGYREAIAIVKTGGLPAA